MTEFIPPSVGKSETVAPRPKSNWAQIASAVISFATVALAFYALFFSSASQVVIQYLQSELTSRNQRIMNLESTKESLERSISVKESNIELLDKKSSELQLSISQYEAQKMDMEKRLQALREEQEFLQRAAAEARKQSTQNEFSYIKEKIYSSTNSIFIMTWPIRIIGEKRTSVKRETVWPHYFNYYKSSVAKFPENERVLGERILALFERKCGRFKQIVFDIPVAPDQIVPGTFERKTDDRIEKITKRAFDVAKQIEDCLRSLQDE